MLAKTSPKLFKSGSFGLVNMALLPSKNSDEMNSNARRVAIVMMIKYCYSCSIKNVATLNNIRFRILLTYKLCLYVRMVHAMEVYSMSIATGDKKISLRVGGKDLALNDGFPLSNPEDFKDTHLKSSIKSRMYSGDSETAHRPTLTTDEMYDNLLVFENSRTDVLCGVGVGSSGKNHGIFSSTCKRDCPDDGWLIRATDTGSVYIYGKLVRDSKGNWYI